MTLPVPYPADTKAKGWRFEIDYEKVEQSDTWTLASFEVRPWLLMLWMTAASEAVNRIFLTASLKETA